jgi:aldehyde dehydrogenase (NAD+)
MFPAFTLRDHIILVADFSLQLGGKSPVIIDPKMDLKIAARRVLWGKCINAGQVRALLHLPSFPQSYEWFISR